MILHIKYSVGIILGDLAPLPVFFGGVGGILGFSYILMLFIQLSNSYPILMGFLSLYS